MPSRQLRRQHVSSFDIEVDHGEQAIHLRHGQRVLFATATDWVTRLTDAHHTGQLEAELKKIRRYKLIIVDEVGYIPVDNQASNWPPEKV